MKWIGKHPVFSDLMIGGVLLTPPDNSIEYELTLPNNDGGAGQVLSTDGDGLLSWVDNGVAVPNALTIGTGLDLASGNSTWNGSAAETIQLDLTEVITSDANNKLLTSNGNGTLTAEANLNFVATAFTIGGDDSITNYITRAQNTTGNGGDLRINGGTGIGTNLAGGDLILAGGGATGSGLGGDIKFLTIHQVGSSGTALNVTTDETLVLSGTNAHLGEDVTLSFEGATDNGYETTLTVTDPTADRTVTFQDATGTVALTSDIVTYATASSTSLGVIKIEDDAEQTVAANSVSATSHRTYGLQLNSSKQAVVNVPWTDTDTTYSAGNLLDLSTTTFNVDLTESAAATIAAGDNIIFLDGGASGTASKGSINDVATLFAGTASSTGLSANTGVLSITDLHPVGVDGISESLLTDDGDGTVTSHANLTFFVDGGTDPTLTITSPEDTGDHFSISTTTHGNTTFSTLDDDADAAHLTFDADGDISLDSHTANNVAGGVKIHSQGTEFARFNVHHAASWMYLYENEGASTDDYAAIGVSAHGSTKIKTEDAVGAAADLELEVDGDIILDPVGDIELQANTQIDGQLILTQSPHRMDWTGPTMLWTSSGGFYPEFTLENTEDHDTKCSVIKLLKDRGAAATDGNNVGLITFVGDNNLQSETTYADIIGGVGTALSTDEAGTLKIQVTASNGTTPVRQNGFEALGHGTLNKVDTNIAYGTGSTTTVAGTLNANAWGFLGGTANAILTDDGDGTVTSEAHASFESDATIAKLTITSPEDTSDLSILKTTTSGATNLSTVDSDGLQAAAFTLDVDGTIDLDAARNGLIKFSMGGTQFGQVGAASSLSTFMLYEAAGATVADYFKIDCDTHGATTITTHDTASHAADLTMDIDGEIIIDSHDGKIDFDHATSTMARIQSTLGNVLDIFGNSSGSAKIKLYEDTSNGTNTITVQAPSDISSDKTIALPDTSGTVQLQGSNTGQVSLVQLTRHYYYIFYLNTRDFWYSTGGHTYTSGTTASAGVWAMDYIKQTRLSSFIFPAAAKIKKVRTTFYMASSCFNATTDIALEFALQKWTPGNNSAVSVNTTLLTNTNHDGNFREAKSYNLEFDVTDNAAASFASGDAFGFFARTTSTEDTASCSGTQVRVAFYGTASMEIEYV